MFLWSNEIFVTFSRKKLPQTFSENYHELFTIFLAWMGPNYWISGRPSQMFGKCFCTWPVNTETELKEISSTCRERKKRDGLERQKKWSQKDIEKLVYSKMFYHMSELNILSTVCLDYSSIYVLRFVTPSIDKIKAPVSAMKTLLGWASNSRRGRKEREKNGSFWEDLKRAFLQQLFDPGHKQLQALIQFDWAPSVK